MHGRTVNAKLSRIQIDIAVDVVNKVEKKRFTSYYHT